MFLCGRCRFLLSWLAAVLFLGVFFGFPDTCGEKVKGDCKLSGLFNLVQSFDGCGSAFHPRFGTMEDDRIFVLPERDELLNVAKWMELSFFSFTAGCVLFCISHSVWIFDDMSVQK